MGFTVVNKVGGTVVRGVFIGSGAVGDLVGAFIGKLMGVRVGAVLVSS